MIVIGSVIFPKHLISIIWFLRKLKVILFSSMLKERLQSSVCLLTNLMTFSHLIFVQSMIYFSCS